MSSTDFAALFLMTGILFIGFTVLWQMYVVLSEVYALDSYQNSTRMPWIAAAMFFSFSLAIYWFCPKSRKKGLVFFLCGCIGILCYGLGMWYKKQSGM